MLIWLFYDISRNRIRARVAKLCKQSGLHRVQKSVFSGKITANNLKGLQQDIAGLIRPQTDVLHIQPVNRQDYSKLLRYGQQAVMPRMTSRGDVSFF